MHDHDEAHNRELLSSAIDKVARKYERISAPARAAFEDHDTLMKLTIGELRVLKQFHSKFHDD